VQPLHATKVADFGASGAVELMQRDGGMRVSAFEDYLKCPFIFYARHIVKLDEEREPSVELPALTRGDLMHRVLENFLKEEIETKRLPPLSKLAATLDEELKLKPLEGQFRDPHLLRASRNRLLARLEGWYEYERARREDFPDLRPVALEHSLTFTLPESGFTLKGRADRIDGDGTSLVVIDYKSGGSPLAGKELLSGHGAQLLAYSAAARTSLNLEPAAAWYLELGTAVTASKGFFLKSASGKVHKANARNGGLTDATFDDVLHGVMARWEEAAQNLKSGIFTPRPAQAKNCARCAHVFTCGYPVGLEDGEGGGADE
jgi:ATP-dependent helicase/DNAse subunit B